MKVELFEAIRREHEHGAGTTLGIARKLGVHRRMVRQALQNAVPPQRKIPQRQRPKLEPAVAFIDVILLADQKAPRKQRHTAHRIWARLRREKPEVAVGESTVREYVRQRKRELGLQHRETFIPQSYAYGSEGQVDWYEAWAEMDGELRQVYVFCMRSMASGAAFHRAYPHATQQAFLEAHELAFQYFGGVFRLLRYDNLKSAVKKILRGRQREETARFIAFRSHWRFTSDFCNPGEGHEKGGVEGEGGQYRRNHLVPVPQVRDLEALNQHLLAECREDEQRVIAGRTQTVGAGMLAEREHLLPLAAEPFDLAALHFPKVNSSSCVHVLTNFYSAPLPEGEKVEVKVYSAYVEVWQHGRCLTRHERCFGRYQKVLELDHYLEPLLKKPGALAGSTALEQCRAQGRWPASYDQFWELLKQRHGRSAGTRAMVEVLLLGRESSPEQLRAAVEQALQCGCTDVSAVRLSLQTARLAPRPIAEVVEIGALRDYDRPAPSLKNYDQLLGTVAMTGVQA
jgi:transposase